MQPCSAMTNGALGGKCPGAYANIRRSPGFAPNPVSSRSRVGRVAGATRARAAFFRADARRLSNLLRNAWRRERISRGSRTGNGPYCSAQNNIVRCTIASLGHGVKTFSAMDRNVRSMSALPPIADIGTQPRNVRFVPKAASCGAAKNSCAGLYMRAMAIFEEMEQGVRRSPRSV